MIYFCADDYGMCDISSEHIKECTHEGVINKVSVFSNFGEIDLSKLTSNNKINLSLHINLVEGKCMTYSGKTDMLSDKHGYFKNTFTGLLVLSILKRKMLEKRAYEEIKVQISTWKKLLPESTPFMVDSHQHIHMIPAIFKALIKVLEDERINTQYLRIPAEPLLPYIKAPSLYFTYSAVNIIKQWLLKFLWIIDKKYIKGRNIPTAYFFGILFSGKMDEKRVNRILPEYIKLAKKKNKNIEVLLHPGYISENEFDLRSKGIVFDRFYTSENRKTEYNTAMKIKTKEE